MQLILVLVAMISLSRAFVLSASGSRRSPLRMASLLSAMSTSSGSEHSSNSAPFNSLSNIAVSASDGWSLSGELLVVPFYKAPKDVKGDEAIAAHLKTKIPSQLPSDIQEIVSSVIEDGQFKADAASKQVVRVTGSSVKHIALVGLGSADTTASEDFGTSQTKGSDLEVKVVSKFGRNLATIAKSTKAKSMSIVCPASLGKGGLSQMLIAFYDALYIDHRFKKPSETLKKPEIAQMTLIGCDANVAQDAELVNLLSRKIADGVVWAKDLVGAPPNYKTPIFIAEAAKQMASDLGLECKVLGEEECKALNMGGYLGVQQGSRYPPQFVHMVYRPQASADQPITKVAFVGKGLTFDSGGYNLKTGAGSMIELMKFDMGGCAAVLGAAKAIAQLRPSTVEVHFITALCENMISQNAMKPGDILTTMNGKTIEVLNTDAEGRLTLADALAYAEKQNVDYIIDLATLTGACIMGLGEKVAAYYTPNTFLKNAIAQAAARTDESVWQMPLEERYRESIKSKLADVKNIAGIKGGGSITAALFLQEFIEKTPWAHIDMAGPVWDSAGGGKPTGFGVKTLVDFVLNLPPKQK